MGFFTSQHTKNYRKKIKTEIKIHKFLAVNEKRSLTYSKLNDFSSISEQSAHAHQSNTSNFSQITLYFKGNKVLGA